MTDEVAKEFAEISRRLFNIEKQLSDYVDLRHETSTTNISDAQDALCEVTTDVTARVASIEDALCELSQ